jgi:hypothetical protein
MGRMPSGACLPAAAGRGRLRVLGSFKSNCSRLHSTIGHTFVLLAPPRFQIIFRKCRRLGRQEVEKGSNMNSPNNLLFDSEMATSRVRKAFESAPESDLGDRSYRLSLEARSLRPGGVPPHLLLAICYLLFV